MNRAQRRASQQEGKRLQKKAWNRFEDVTFEARAKHHSLSPDSGYSPCKVYQNHQYIVQVFYGIERKGKYYTRVMVRRSDSAPICSWSDLFRIKNEIFGEEVEAVQFLPPKSELTDVANLYWFWIEEANHG